MPSTKTASVASRLATFLLIVGSALVCGCDSGPLNPDGGSGGGGHQAGAGGAGTGAAGSSAGGAAGSKTGHAGASGTAGPVVVPLQLAATPGGASGEGTIDAAAIKGKRADGSLMTMDDLLAALRSGGLYVNVHTANNKAGEVRGQITP